LTPDTSTSPHHPEGELEPRAQIRAFVLCKSEDGDSPGEDIAYGLQLPDGTAICVMWGRAGESSIAWCQSVRNAEYMHGAESVWLDHHD
jgi:hypothetical protein